MEERPGQEVVAFEPNGNRQAAAKPATKITRRTWSDREIRKEEQDRFSFQDYARVLANRVMGADTPLTIGIYGRWGSGKSSLMRLIDSRLPEKTEDDGMVSCIWINVWRLSNQDEVWHAFLQALFSKVQRELSLWQRIDKRKLLRQLASNLYRIVLVMTPLIVGVLIARPDADWSDVASLLNQMAEREPESLLSQPAAWLGAWLTLGLGLWALVKPAIGALRETVNFDLESVLRYAPYEVQVTELMRLQGRFEEMVELLVGEHGRLVVFIDDLDRCTPDKVPDVLEAIKLFTTTDRCVYVLGLDYDIVRQGIELKYGFKSKSDADEYLEKIVQVPFNMPPLDEGKIKEFVRAYYPNLRQRSRSAPEVFSAGLEPNPRKVKRALNIYRTLLDLAEERWKNWEMDRQIDPELLAKMVVIQNRFRNLYEQLIEHPALLPELETDGQIDSLDASEMDEDLEAELKNPALGAMLGAGEVFFRELESDDLNSYIYLTGTAEGGGAEVRASSRERRALLGGDPEAIGSMAAEILERGGSDEEARERIRGAYVERLTEVLGDFERYTAAERASANMALDFLEGWGRQEFEPETLRIPAGPFLMGSDPEKDKNAGDDEGPQHELELPAYRLGRYPVTNAQYQAFVRESDHEPPEGWRGQEFPRGKGEHPVVNVSWHDAVAYCQWLSRETGREYGLPSEAEWEKAARGVDGRIYPWGDEFDPALANTDESGVGDTSPVGDFPNGASPYGLLDMSGNVWEWTISIYRPYPYDAGDGREEMEDAEARRALRGGSWLGVLDFARAAYRDYVFPSYRYYLNGFRLLVRRPPSQ